MKLLLPLLLAGVIAGATFAAPASETFVGLVTDESCAGTRHDHMGMGPTDAECAKACVSEHAVPFVLFTDTGTWTLSDQKAAEQFAAQRVQVVGTLDTAKKLLKVESMTAVR